MKHHNKRASDSTFDLNLAPFLDIIVSIVPMLLLSVAFVQVKMIEAPTPQVVNEQTAKTPPKPEASVLLKISKKSGFEFEVTDIKGKISKIPLNMISGQFDYDGLLETAIKIKSQLPDVSRLQLQPDGDIAFDDIIRVIDQVRQKPRAPAANVSITDAANAKPVENSYLFPDVIFASVGG